MRRTGTSHAPRAAPMSIHKIEIGGKPFPHFPICSKETLVIPASLPIHTAAAVLIQFSNGLFLFSSHDGVDDLSFFGF